MSFLAKARGESHRAQSDSANPRVCFNPPHRLFWGVARSPTDLMIRQTIGIGQPGGGEILNRSRSDRIPSGRYTGIRLSLPSIDIRISPSQGSSSVCFAAIAKSQANCDKGIRAEFVRSSRVTLAEWLLERIMSSSQEKLRGVATEYCQSRQLELLTEVLGFGVHGNVYVCEYHSQISERNATNAIKVHEQSVSYLRERDVYLRLRDLGIESVQGHAVPQLIDYDDELLVIEMSIVTRPFVLDFGGAYLDHAPEFDPEVLKQWEHDKEEQFEENWPKAASILSELREYGIFVMDVNPGNIGFRQKEESDE